MNQFQELKERKVLDKDGKVDAMGPYGRSKLTGQEVAQYFRKNKVKDAKIKKAVEVALDLGGADAVARKEIKKFYGDKILKSKEVQSALQYANESYTFNSLCAYLQEDLTLVEKNLMPAIEKIVADKGAAKVGGITIDMFTASVVKQVYDKVNDANKKKMEKANIQTLVKLAHKVMGMKEEVINEKLDLVVTVKGDKNVALALKAMKKFRGISVLRQGKVKSGQVAVFGGDEKQLQKMQSALAGKIKGLDMVSTHEAANPAQQAAIAISKKEKAGKPGYDKEGKSLKNKKEEDEKPLEEDATQIFLATWSGILGAALLPFAYMSAKELAKPVIKSIADKFKKNKNYKMSNSEKSEVKGFFSKIKKEKPSAYKKIQTKAKSVKEGMSVMDSYRQMWEDALDEQVSDITVDPRNKISKSADQNKHAAEIAKQAKRFGLKSSMMGKHVRVKGSKKAVNDFLRIIIGKSSYGDPTEKDMSTPQIDKMLTKGLK